MSEDRQDSPKPVEEDPPPLLKRLLFGVFAGIFLSFLESGFGYGFGYYSGSIWESLLAVVGAGCVFGVIIGVVLPWVAPDRFKEFCVCSIAGGAAGTTTWLIVQAGTPVAFAVGAGAVLGGLFYLFG